KESHNSWIYFKRFKALNQPLRCPLQPLANVSGFKPPSKVFNRPAACAIVCTLPAPPTIVEAVTGCKQ
ncbi:MAG TPA: hypothetical protein VKA49_21815, partial [Flavitalea sp.]|nr:hypothetical protein [Flavitalea sp.]